MAMVLLAALTCFAYPPPAPEDVSNFGANMQRTMTLLATSTPQKQNTVRILFYGQSFTMGSWTYELVRWLKATYPYANIVVKNLCIAGFPADVLERVSEHDIYPFYPDLMIMHDFVDNATMPMLDSMIQRTRSRTAAEVALLGNQVFPYEAGTDVMFEYRTVPIAQRYECEQIPLRDQWRQYLLDNNLRADDLLRDSQHPNEWGNYLYGELVKRHFRYDPSIPRSRWQDYEQTYRVGQDVHFEDGALTLSVTGTRIDVILAPNTPQNAPAIEAFIDSERPSAFRGCYYVTRANDAPGSDMYTDSLEAAAGFSWAWGRPVVLRVSLGGAFPRLEDWTITLTELHSDDGSNVDFTLSGSLTGYDGTGNTTRDFESSSDRISIESSDWGLEKYAFGNFGQGTKLPFSVYRVCTDTIEPEQFTEATPERVVTIAQGITNGGHTLTLRLLQDGAPCISAIRVYQPPFGRSPASRRSAQAPMVRLGRPCDDQSRLLFDIRGRRANIRAHRGTAEVVQNVAAGVYLMSTTGTKKGSPVSSLMLPR